MTKIRVLVFPVSEPGQPKAPGVEQEIGDDLDSMQKLVGGTIQIVPYLGGAVDLVCDDDGKCNGKKRNRVAWDGADTIFGTFFFCRHNDKGEAVSVTDEDIAKLQAEFQ